MRTNFKEIDMGRSSLETEVSLYDLRNRCGGRFNLYESDSYWFQREMQKNANYLSSPVAVINFDYLENN